MIYHTNTLLISTLALYATNAHLASSMHTKSIDLKNNTPSSLEKIIDKEKIKTIIKLIHNNSIQLDKKLFELSEKKHRIHLLEALIQENDNQIRLGNLNSTLNNNEIKTYKEKTLNHLNPQIAKFSPDKSIQKTLLKIKTLNTSKLTMFSQKNSHLFSQRDPFLWAYKFHPEKLYSLPSIKKLSTLTPTDKKNIMTAILFYNHNSTQTEKDSSINYFLSKLNKNTIIKGFESKLYREPSFIFYLINKNSEKLHIYLKVCIVNRYINLIDLFLKISKKNNTPANKRYIHKFTENCINLNALNLIPKIADYWHNALYVFHEQIIKQSIINQDIHPLKTILLKHPKYQKTFPKLIIQIITNSPIPKKINLQLLNLTDSFKNTALAFSSITQNNTWFNYLLKNHNITKSEIEQTLDVLFSKLTDQTIEKIKECINAAKLHDINLDLFLKNLIPKNKEIIFGNNLIKLIDHPELFPTIYKMELFLTQTNNNNFQKLKSIFLNKPHTYRQSRLTTLYSQFENNENKKITYFFKNLPKSYRTIKDDNNDSIESLSKKKYLNFFTFFTTFITYLTLINLTVIICCNKLRYKQN